MSIFSLGNSDGFNEDSDEISPDDLSHNKGFFHRPFIYKILKLNTPEWRWILLGTIVSIVYGGVTPLYGLIFANVYGTFGASDVHEQERLTRNYSIISFCLGLGVGIAQFLTSLSFGKSGEALTMRLRKLTFNAMLRQEMAYFDKESNTTGALITRLSADASALKVIINIIFS
jgi:ABC-type multidrug transport system fused ATPase/permease subunit